MKYTLAPLLALPLALSSLTACTGHGSSSAAAPMVVTVGSLASGARMSQVSSDGTSWAVALGESDLTLTINGVEAVFREAKVGSTVNYQFDSKSGTWTFLVNGGEVHWHGSEVRVGDTTHDLSVPGEYVFSVADWSKVAPAE